MKSQTTESEKLSKTQIKRKSILQAKRIGPMLSPDRSRVLMRPFFPVRNEIAKRIFDQVNQLSNSETEKLVLQVLGEFENRHENLKEIFLKRFIHVKKYLELEMEISHERKILIGSYFSHEYSPESAALFNPSIVIHPDQKGLPDGSLRFILSLRATGEGHISSITFRTGNINAQHRITLTASVPFVVEPESLPNAVYEKKLFIRKLQEAGIDNLYCKKIMDQIQENFILEDLKKIVNREKKNIDQLNFLAERAYQGILLLAESNFEVAFNPDSQTSQRILFPCVPSQSNGIEDARFVRFQSEENDYTYYATYTAYDGKITLPQLLETKDFIHFKFLTLNGPAVQNKGMALFPRKIKGQFAMLSRQDDQNILLMYSENIHFWQTPKIILQPKYDWELVKIGTCGSPIETEYGWLVLSHGVGPMRKYCLGAFLLDLNDPSIVIGRLKYPLISPNETEREGYVPNVIYTCGAIIHGTELIIPYAMSDYGTSFAIVNLEDLIHAME